MSATEDGPPTVVVAAHPAAPPEVAREVHAGVEEQGVPTAGVVLPDDAVAGARAAARRSRLEVGVGIGADGTVAVVHALVGPPVVELGVGAGPGEHRLAGGDAARIVTGLPLTAGQRWHTADV